MGEKKGDFQFIFLIFCASLFIASFNNSYPRQVIFPEPLSERIANYDIDASLNTDKKLVTGDETLYWKNTSKDKIYELEFHLYLNAFKNTKSTFIRESGGSARDVLTRWVP